MIILSLIVYFLLCMVGMHRIQQLAMAVSACHVTLYVYSHIVVSNLLLNLYMHAIHVHVSYIII